MWRFSGLPWLWSSGDSAIRSGKVLDSDFGDKSQKPDPKMVEKVTDILTNKYKVEVKLGSSGAQFI